MILCSLRRFAHEAFIGPLPVKARARIDLADAERELYLQLQRREEAQAAVEFYRRRVKHLTELLSLQDSSPTNPEN